MRARLLFCRWTVVMFTGCMFLGSFITVGATELPSRIADHTYWQMISNFSEHDGVFGSDNFVSNENLFDGVLSEIRNHQPGGVYVGVGPEQNFTYIATLAPRLAFVVDIRRQNMIEHLMYKAVFERSNNRADFLSWLFARPRPNGLDRSATVRTLFEAYDSVSPDDSLFKSNLKLIKEDLLRHGFALTKDDIDKLDYIYRAFFTIGPQISYWSRPWERKVGQGLPTYESIMEQAGNAAQNWSYLATETSFQTVKNLEEKNLIVPVVGDFAGPTALRAIGAFLKQYDAPVTTVYASNVEQFLFESSNSWKKYYSSLLTLPVHSNCLFIRSVAVTDEGVGTTGSHIRTVMMTEPLADLLKQFSAKRIMNYQDILLASHCAKEEFARYGCRP